MDSNLELRKKADRAVTHLVTKAFRNIFLGNELRNIKDGMTLLFWITLCRQNLLAIFFLNFSKKKN